jgi:hypothetical protein
LAKEEVIADWRQMHNEELHNLHTCGATNIRIFNSRRIKREGHIPQRERIIADKMYRNLKKEVI